MHNYTFDCVKCGLRITKKSMAEFQAAIDKHTEGHLKNMPDPTDEYFRF